MSTQFFREKCDTQRRVFMQAALHCGNPIRCGPFARAACLVHEPLHCSSKILYFRLPGTKAHQISRGDGTASSYPPCDRSMGNHPGSKPGRIELDLDLLESNARNTVLVGRSGSVKDDRRTGDENLANFRPI